MTEKWSKEKAWQWYNGKPLIVGFNFIPSNVINFVELWQNLGHDEIMKNVDHEIDMAAELGLNSVRMKVPFFIWEHEHDSFMNNLEDLLCRLDKRGITMMPVFFSDCCVPIDMYKPPHLGKQPEPVKGYFGGSPVTPFDSTPRVGYIPEDDRDTWPKVEEFIREIVGKYAKDERILIWDIWNEPGNCNRSTMSLPLMERCFRWAREMDPIQPLCAGPCGLGGKFPYEYLMNPYPLAPMEEKAVELSDIMNFHFYGDYAHTVKYIEHLKGYGLPMVCTEWLHRPFRSNIETHLPLFAEENIGSYFFGFVNGKRQYNQPWENIRRMPDIDLTCWMHDIYYNDGRPYEPRELDVIKKVTGK